MKKILQDLSLEELEAELTAQGEKKFRAAQIYGGMLSGKTIEELPAVPNALKEKLLQTYENAPVSVEKVFYSSDGTEKYLFRLSDGNIIEGVLMKYKYGYTQCVSTQVGCRMGCRFCASTLNGLIRNLTAGEILSQILVVNALHKGDPDLPGSGKEKRAVTNVVLMGSGEPLDNYDNVVKFLRILRIEGGLCIGMRSVSLSTCGLVENMRRFAEEDLPVTLSLSLHAPNDEVRRKLMPVARKYSMDDVLSACRNYIEKTGRRVIFEYALVHGVNADPAQAVVLAGRLRGMQCHVNLIPLNSVPERGLTGVTEREVDAFKHTLEQKGISVTRRREMGDDIEGACGQLRRRYIQDNNLNTEN